MYPWTTYYTHGRRVNEKHRHHHFFVRKRITTMADDAFTAPEAASLEEDEICEQDCEELNLTFDDIDEDSLIRSLQTEANESTPSAASTRMSDDDVDCGAFKKGGAAMEEDYASNDADYILGTLIVRVVAARDLEAVHKHGLGNLFFGGGIGKGQSRSGKGTANPYASVRFGDTIQRTSEAYETTDPIWPRGEAMYMDVTHEAWEASNDASEEMDVTAKEDSSKESLPGDPPKKFASSAMAAAPRKPKEGYGTANTVSPDNSFHSPPKPILTVAIFHASDAGRLHKFPNKGGGSGDSDDVFLGMTSVDLTHVLTGKVGSFDEWLPLQGSNSAKASVRIVCEYETSDSPPQPGDVVKFTDFCHPADLYPAVQSVRSYVVQEIDGDEVLIAWTSGEGWVSSFQVHRFMLICVERHHSVVDICQDELASLRERISFSPMVHAVQETVERVPDEGLLNVGADALKNGASLLARWWENGIETTAHDLNFATNWDGRHNPNTTDSLATLDASDDETESSPNPYATLDVAESIVASHLVLEALPNMPPCPITGEPMRDPVVAADGHTYERAAIARWLAESNKSPLTGAVLSHKDLVPNYMLLSSLQEAAAATKPPKGDAQEQGVEEDEEGVTAEVNIDD